MEQRDTEQHRSQNVRKLILAKMNDVSWRDWWNRTFFDTFLHDF
jgi:hypothetical protein